MFDNDETGASLRAIFDASAPPATTTVDQVLRLGRRRKLLQRATMAAVVMAVIGGVGIGAAVLRAPAESGSDTAAPPSTGQPALLPGWERVPMPVAGTTGCDFRTVPSPPEMGLPPQDLLRAVFVDTLEEVLGPPVELVHDNTETGKPTSTSAFLDAEFSVDGDGPFSMGFEVTSFAGSPVEGADAHAGLFDYNRLCEPPSRRIESDGTVYQLFSPTDPGQQFAKGLQVYRPDNRMYILTAKSFSLGRLPVDDSTLVIIGERLVAAITE